MIEHDYEKRSRDQLDPLDENQSNTLDEQQSALDYDNQNYEQENEEQNHQQKHEKKRAIDEQSNFDTSNDISDADIKQALSKLSPNELMVLDKLVNNDNTVHENDDQELIRESRSSKKHKHKNCKKDDDDEDDDDDNDENEDEGNENENRARLSNLFNQQECFGANCKGGCVIKRIKIRGKRDSNSTTPDSTPPANGTSSLIQSSSDQKSNFDTNQAKKQSKRQATPYYAKRSYSPNLDRQIQGKITYLRDKGNRNSMKRSFGPKRNMGYHQYVRRKRESGKLDLSADDPKNPEHLKLLEESFPNPADGQKSFQSNEPLVRVKRHD